MLHILILGLIAAHAEGYAISSEMQADVQLCYDFSALRAGGLSHGPPESTDPDNFVSFDVKRDNSHELDDVYDINVELNREIEGDSFAGWAIHVREYGRANISSSDSFAFGSVISYSGISDGWDCPTDYSNTTTLRNGIVHLNGNANKEVEIRSIDFKWSHRTPTSQDAPSCAKVVATIMTANDNWWWAQESPCFMHNNGTDVIIEECPEECGSGFFIF